MFGLSKAERRLSELEEGLRKLKLDQAGLELEWVNTQGKLKKIMGRLVKSVSFIEQHEETESALSDAATAVPGSTPLSAHHLSLQQKILAHRKRLMGGGGSD